MPVKLFGCRNLGLPSAAEYHSRIFGWATRRSAQPAAAIPLFNEREFRPWLAAYLTDHARRYGYFARYAISGILFATAAIRRVRNAFSAATVKGLDAKIPHRPN